MYAVNYVRDFRLNNKDCLLEIGDESLNSKMDPTLFFLTILSNRKKIKRINFQFHARFNLIPPNAIHFK